MTTVISTEKGFAADATSFLSALFDETVHPHTGHVEGMSPRDLASIVIEALVEEGYAIVDRSMLKEIVSVADRLRGMGAVDV